MLWIEKTWSYPSLYNKVCNEAAMSVHEHSSGFGRSNRKVPKGDVRSMVLNGYDGLYPLGEDDDDNPTAE